jgi:AmiR/NasT family two-component response regulator
MMYFEDEDDDKIVSATRAGLDGYLVFPFKEKDLETMLKKIW